MAESLITYLAIGFALGVVVGLVAYSQDADKLATIAIVLAMSFLWLPAAVMLVVAALLGEKPSKHE